jgi:hypothetical protein
MVVSGLYVLRQPARSLYRACAFYGNPRRAYAEPMRFTAPRTSRRVYVTFRTFRTFYSDVHAPTPLASAPKFYIRYTHPISLGRHQPYIVTVANACGYTQGPFWLPWRIALVGRENHIEDVRFLCSPLTTPANTTLPLQRGRWNLAISYGWEPHDIWQRSRRCGGARSQVRREQSSCSQAYGFATITSEIGCVPNLKFWSAR